MNDTKILDGKKILVIDDMRENLITAKVLLRKILPQHHVFLAQSAAEGLQVAKEQQVDTILLDVQMPEMNGFEATKMFKDHPKTQNVPIIIVTALTGKKENKIKALECGADAFLSKPLDHSELAAVVNSMLRIKSAEDMLQTEKMQLASALYKSESLFHSVFNSAPTAMLVLDQQLALKTWNPEAARIFNLNEKQQKNLTDLLSKKINIPDDFLHEINKVLQRNNTFLLEDEFEYAGDKLTLVWKINRFTDKEKNTAGFVALTHDITERKKYEQKQREAREKAQEADKLKTAFLANMSHEIRTPMNAIVGFSGLLSDTELSQQKRDLYIKQINDNSDHLLQLINDILDVSKIEAGKIEISLQEVEVNQLLHDLFVTFQTQNKINEQVSLLLNVPFKNDKFWIETDPNRLKQVLSNLLSNGLKFTNSGTVELGYVVLDEQTIEFYVKDTGIGIPKDKQQDIFERFFKIDEDKNRFYGGTGLGLSIAKDLVELMGGQISLESELNNGTIVFVSFDIKNNAKAIAYDQQIDLFTFNPPNWQRKKVLVAEDEEINFLFLQEVLLETGIDITWVKNGKQAFELILSAEHFDLILMDMKMPQMDGFEATRKIKQISDVHIIAQTAYAMENEVKKCFEAGCDSYLSKPLLKNELFTEMNKFLKTE